MQMKNDKEFYDQLNAYIEEYTEEYIHKLRGIAREILSREESDINLEELEDYLQAQEHMFMERLEQTIKEVQAEIEEDGVPPLKEKVLIRIKNSFSSIFEKVVSSLKDMIG